MSNQIQRLDFEIQAFLDQAYKRNQGVGTCEIGGDVKEHGLTLKETGILAVNGRTDLIHRIASSCAVVIVHPRWRFRNAATFARLPQAAALQNRRRWAFVPSRKNSVQEAPEQRLTSFE